MSDEKIKIDLDPRSVLQSTTDMGEAFTKLSDKVEEALGKDAVKSIAKLQDSAEKGTNKIQSYFSQLGQRVKEDLKTAFDATGILAGAKMAKEIAEGTKQVFEMERAFDRLNTRLKLSTKQMTDFKLMVGKKVSATGQRLEDVLPGVETAAAKGNVKSPEQLASIAETLGKAKATTGEETEGLSDTIVEILKSQGQKVTGDTFKQTMDALQATRVQGSFKTASEAGHAISDLSPFAKQLGLGTRDLGGLAAMAGKSGAGGMHILQQLMEQSTKFGGASRLNATLGQDVFKVGKEGQATGMNAGALGKVNMQSPQIMEAITGLTGSSGGDLQRFIGSFKDGMDDFKKVTSGANETADQFESATQNLASGIDRFRERAKEAGREVGGAVSAMANDLIKGNFKGAFSHASEGAKALHENKGTIVAAGVMTVAAGVLAGGGLNRLLSKIPGGSIAGNVAGSAMAAQAAKMAGIQPVYVTNAKEMSGQSASMVDDFLKKTTSMAGAGGAVANAGKFGKIAGAAGNVMGALGVAAVGFEIGQAVGEALMTMPLFSKAADKATDVAYDALHGDDQDAMDEASRKAQQDYLNSPAHKQSTSQLTPEAIAAAVEKGTHAGVVRSKSNTKAVYTNPSVPTGMGKM